MDNRDFSAEYLRADDLTWREQEVLALLSERLTNREIAERLHLAESTVKDYVVKILSKLYVKNRRQAVERAKALGLLGDEQGTPVRSPTNLPAEPTQFVGRTDELAELNRLLSETRLLTLTGPGGMGKTRLALKAAKDAVDDFVDGRFFVSLAPLRSADHMVQTIAEGVGFPLATNEDPQRQLLRHLRNRKILLVMDNFEHLLDGVGIISEILQSAPGVKILATTRERLNLRSETIFHVGGMSYSGEVECMNYDAVNLFLQSARKVQPRYNPSTGELEQILQICQIVQGMPLAIELAAAWLSILNVNDIVGELEIGIEILATEVRDTPERHRSMQSVFDHSWSMLDRTEQEVFKQLSVFRGGFTREAAQKVTGATLHQLTDLINKSFLSHNPDSGRLEIHEMLREYTQEKLEKTLEGNTSAQEAHAAYFAEFMDYRWGELKCDRQMLALVEIEADIANVRAAWRYYLDQINALQMLKFIHSFREVHWIRGWNHAGMELFKEAAGVLQEEEDDESIAVFALAIAFQGYFLSWLGLSDQGFQLARRSIEILERLNRPQPLVYAYESFSLNAYCLNKSSEEIVGKNRLLEIATELDDKWLLALAMFEASMGALRNGDYKEARRCAQASLDINEEIGNRIRSVLPLLTLGHTDFAVGEYAAASNYYQRILGISQNTGFLWGIEKACKYLGVVALSIDNIEEAEQYLRQSLIIIDEIGLVRDKLNVLYEYARLLVAQGESEQASEMLALIIQHPVSHQIRLGEGRIKDSAESLLTKIEDQLPPDVYSTALERGQDLDVDEVICDLINQQF